MNAAQARGRGRRTSPKRAAQAAAAALLALALAPGVARAAVLFDGTPSVLGFHPNSQDFEAVYNDDDALVADDFVIPAGQTWTIQRALIDGRVPIDSGPGTTSTINISLFTTQGTLPSAGSFYAEQITADAGTPYPDFNVALPNPPILTAGTYWIGAQPVMNFDPDDNYWVWGTVTTQRGNPAAWRNPGGGQGIGCTSFGVMATCIPAVVNPDVAFRLEGTCNGCPAPPSTTPPAKKCKKGQKLKKGKCVKKKKKKRKKK